MAQMLPYPVSNFKSESEEQLYCLFQDRLGPDYTVFYGRTWSDHSSGGNPDPECDFIVTKPGSGILIIEAKGGKWERVNGNWRCYGRPVKPADDPFEQAKSNKAALIRLLKSTSKWEKVYFPVSYALALPDTSFNNDNEFIGLPNILTFDELDHVEYWLEDAMADCLRSNYPAKTDSSMHSYILQTLMKDYVVRLSEILHMDDKRLLVFTEQQLSLDRAFTKWKRLTVQGCAGSGKTLMALRQVKRLAKNSDVKRILFTCYNRELGQWLAENTKELKIQCTTMPVLDFFESQAKEVGIVNGPDKNDPNYYDTLPYSFLQANEMLGLKYDAIIADEGQSFKKDWWDILETLLADPEKSHFYIFYDDLQRIYQEVINPVPGDDRPVDLFYNLRNTANIHRQATKFLPNDKLPDCNNIPGEPVWIHFYHDEKSMQGALRKILRLLIREGGVSSKDIIILTPKKKYSVLGSKEKLGPYSLLPLESDNPAAIRYSTIQSFRGMERQVVILTEIDSSVNDLRSLFYLGCSRAKTKLVLLVSNDLEDGMKQKLEQGCEDITNRE